MLCCGHDSMPHFTAVHFPVDVFKVPVRTAMHDVRWSRSPSVCGMATCLQTIQRARQQKHGKIATLSKEAHGVLLLPVHCNRIACCLSLRCVRTKFVGVINLTDHDASFAFASAAESVYSCCCSALCWARLIQLKTSVRRTTTWLLEVWQLLEDHPNILVQDQRMTAWTLLLPWIVLLIASAARMDTKVDSMMDRLEKRIDERIDSKLGPLMDRLSALEQTNSSSTRSGPSSMSDKGASAGQSSAGGNAPAVFAPSYLEIKGWCGFRDRGSGQGIGPDLDSLVARVGVVRVRNTKIICHLKTSSLSSCKQIREAMNAFVEKENIKLGPQETTPFATEEKPAWRQEQQRPFGKALGVAEHHEGEVPCARK